MHVNRKRMKQPRAIHPLTDSTKRMCAIFGHDRLGTWQRWRTSRAMTEPIFSEGLQREEMLHHNTLSYKHLNLSGIMVETCGINLLQSMPRNEFAETRKNS